MLGLLGHKIIIYTTVIQIYDFLLHHKHSKIKPLFICSMLNAYITSYMKTLIFCGEFKYHRNWHWCLTIESSIKSWNNYCVFTITTQPQNVSLYHSRNWPIILERLYDMLIILYVIFSICIVLSDITILYIQMIKHNRNVHRIVRKILWLLVGIFLWVSFIL